MSKWLYDPETDSRNGKEFDYNLPIHENDTLWSIAEQYKPESYSVDRYIKELKELNHLQSDQIYTGNKLIIIYDTLTNIDPNGIQIVSR